MSTLLEVSTAVFFVLFAILAINLSFAAYSLVKKAHTLRSKPSEKVSVIIPAYNEEKNIGSCIESVIQGSYPKSLLEIIVVDDGSSDSTIETASWFPNVHVLKQMHGGKVKALNRGISNSKGSLIITLDADTVVERDSIKNLAAYFTDKRIGAVSSIPKVGNVKNAVTIFQNVEYLYNGLIREGFSRLFNSTLGLSGAFCCYRKSVLEEVGFFDGRTCTEDFDISLQIKRIGYHTLSVGNAPAYTIAPETAQGFFKQRIRWSKGFLQGLVKNRDMISGKYGYAFVFMMLVQLFWIFYSFVSLPLIGYQVAYWFPSSGVFDSFSYIFRWFSLAGPIYVLYMIPQWGINAASIFGVLAGIITSIVMVASLRHFGASANLKNWLAVFFYFPYTILINLATLGSAIAYLIKRGKGSFVK